MNVDNNPLFIISCFHGWKFLHTANAALKCRFRALAATKTRTIDLHTGQSDSKGWMPSIETSAFLYSEASLHCGGCKSQGHRYKLMIEHRQPYWLSYMMQPMNRAAS